MKLLRFTLVLTVLATWFSIAPSRAEDLTAIPPVVVKTIPEAGSQDVAPGDVEIKVVFSKEMADRSWSPVDAWKESAPQMIDQPKYDPDHRTWTIKVKLEPGKTYGYWLNTQKFMNFKDVLGHPAIPYLLVFKTRDR